MTSRCLDSVARSITNANQELDSIILIDNGSSDIGSTFAPERPATIIRLETNVGFTGGMNKGLEKAFSDKNTDWVLLLSNDIELPIQFHKLLAGLTASTRSDSPIILCPHVYYLSDRAKPSYTHGALEIETGELSHHFAADLRKIVFPNYYPAAATVWNRRAYERLSGFNQEYFCYWEDVDLSFRAKEQDVELKLIPELQIHHLGRGTTGGKRAYAEHFKRGREITLAKVQRSLK